jgi:hypothetical protein
MAAGQSPLRQGLPFFAFLALGTYTLSLLTQMKVDYVVRICELTGLLRCELKCGLLSNSTYCQATCTAMRKLWQIDSTLSRAVYAWLAVQDQNKKVVQKNKDPLEIERNLKAELHVRVFPIKMCTCKCSACTAAVPALHFQMAPSGSYYL